MKGLYVTIAQYTTKQLKLRSRHFQAEHLLKQQVPAVGIQYCH